MVGKKTPDGRIKCKVYRLAGWNELVYIGDFDFDMIQWYRFKAEAEFRNQLDGPTYEFHSDWSDSNTVVGQAIDVGIREEPSGAESGGSEACGFADRVEYELHPGTANLDSDDRDAGPGGHAV